MSTNAWMMIVPLFRYFVCVGLALVGLLLALGAMTGSNLPAQASLDTNAAPSSRSSIDLLRKMSHHGEAASASLATAGPMLPMPVISREASRVTTEAQAISAPAVVTPTLLDAQARIAPNELIPAKPAKKRVVTRKPQNNRYVENTQRGPLDFFGSTQSW